MTAAIASPTVGLRAIRPTPFVRSILLRILWAPVLLVVITFLTFLLNSLAPTDVARVVLGQAASDPELYAQMRERFGLDRPLLVQYGEWLGRALTGDLGTSAFTSQPVSELIGQRLGTTLSLLVGIAVVALVIGMLAGIASALLGGPLARLIDVFSLAGFVLPSFWVALVLVAVFAVDLRWLPASGYVAFAEDPGAWAVHLVLPVAAAGLGAITTIAKHTRDAFSDVLASSYIRALRSVGVRPVSIVFRHALRNAAIPVTTVFGLLIASSVGATVFVEKIFVLPGLGSLTVQAAQESNVPVLQGATLVFTVVVLVVNLGVDVLYGVLDPRVRAA